jgi:hypothetical protein
VIAATLALQLVAAAQGEAPPPVTCTEADTFRFEVVTPNQLGRSPGEDALDGLVFEVVVHVGTLPVTARQKVAEGHLTLCLHGVEEGMFAVLKARSPPQRPVHLMYPGAKGIPVSRHDDPTLIVCEGRDCQVSEQQADQIYGVIVKVERGQREQGRQLAQLSGKVDRLADQHERAQLSETADDVLQSAQRADVDLGALSRLMELKKEQVDAAEKASRLLATFEDTAQEVASCFRRDAAVSMDWKSRAPFDEMNGAAVAHGKVHDELRREADALRKATAGHWGAKRGDDFQALVDEALAVHAHVLELNDVSGLINACAVKAPECPDRGAARKRVAADVARIGREVDDGLKVFETHRRAFEDAQNKDLFAVASRGDAGAAGP